MLARQEGSAGLIAPSPLLMPGHHLEGGFSGLLIWQKGLQGRSPLLKPGRETSGGERDDAVGALPVGAARQRMRVGRACRPCQQSMHGSRPRR